MNAIGRKPPDPRARMVMFVDDTMFVEGRGYRPVFVVEGEDGYRENGDWPYEGKVGQVNPLFFGPSIEDALAMVSKYNERLGITEKEAFIIVAKSMARQLLYLRRSSRLDGLES